MTTIEGLLATGLARLRESGSESARLDAELLLAWAVGVERTTIVAHPEAPVGPAAAGLYSAALARRASGEPVAYIRGLKEFYGLAFSVDRRALIPRPETELLVGRAEAEVARRLTAGPRPAGTPPLRVIDCGTGSGAIAVSLAVALRRRRMLDELSIMAVDRSAAALELARENAVGHAVGDRIVFREADLLPAGEPGFDLVLANLPYIPSAEVDRLPVAASFEPREALDGGPDGLVQIRRLLELLPACLADGGVALLEIGWDQGPGVADALAAVAPGWTCQIERDLAGQPRLAAIGWPASPLRPLAATGDQTSR